MKKVSVSLNTNAEPKYAIVDEKGNILEKFRIKCTVYQMFHYYKDKYFPKELSIITLN